MNKVKKVIIISATFLGVVGFSYLFIDLSNKFFPREDVPTIREASIIAENWIRNFSSLYPYYGRDLQLVEREELDVGEYEFVFSFITERPEYGFHKNKTRIKTSNTEVVSAITNSIFDEKKREYIEVEDTVDLYFVIEDEEEPEVVSTQRVVHASPLEKFERAVVRALFEGPNSQERDEGYTTYIERGGDILSFRVADRTVYIEPSFDIMKSDIAVEQLRKTVSQFEDIDDFQIPERESLILVEVDGIPEEFRFQNDLEEGVESKDVFYLQLILNADPDTVIAQSGPGSPGEERETFDGATKRAVMAFQRKYAREILEPAGMILSTGIVDEYTRDKLNAILEESGW